MKDFFFFFLNRVLRFLTALFKVFSKESPPPNHKKALYHPIFKSLSNSLYHDGVLPSICGALKQILKVTSPSLGWALKQ